jgi:hypothetical protein
VIGLCCRVLAVLLALPKFSAEPTPETDAARESRLRPYGSAIADATEYRPRGISAELWAAALVELGRAESGFAAYVTDDRCLEGPYRCDVDPETGAPRARGAFQVWRAPREPYPACRAVWALPHDHVHRRRAEAVCASQRLAGAYHRCRGRHPDGDIAAAFAGFRSIDCEWAPAGARSARAYALAGRLGL